MRLGTLFFHGSIVMWFFAHRLYGIERNDERI
jgi:hypothetical protein